MMVLGIGRVIHPAVSELVQLRRPGAASVETPEVPQATTPASRRVYLETHGCQMNVADSDLMLGLLANGGYARTEDPKDADLILLNTCAVREKAEEKVFARASMLSYDKARPDVVLGITGCMAEHLKDQILERAPWIDVVAGPDSYRRLGELVARARAVASSSGRRR